MDKNDKAALLIIFLAILDIIGYVYGGMWPVMALSFTAGYAIAYFLVKRKVEKIADDIYET